MIDWLDIPQTDESWPDDDEAWAKVQDRGFDALIANFRRVRQQQIELLNQLTDADWDMPRETLWGQKPLSMVVTKPKKNGREGGKNRKNKPKRPKQEDRGKEKKSRMN